MDNCLYLPAANVSLIALRAIETSRAGRHLDCQQTDSGQSGSTPTHTLRSPFDQREPGPTHTTYFKSHSIDPFNHHSGRSTSLSETPGQRNHAKTEKGLGACGHTCLYLGTLSICYSTPSSSSSTRSPQIEDGISAGCGHWPCVATLGTIVIAVVDQCLTLWTRHGLLKTGMPNTILEGRPPQ